MLIKNHYYFFHKGINPNEDIYSVQSVHHYKPTNIQFCNSNNLTVQMPYSHGSWIL